MTEPVVNHSPKSAPNRALSSSCRQSLLWLRPIIGDLWSELSLKFIPYDVFQFNFNLTIELSKICFRISTQNNIGTVINQLFIFYPPQCHYQMPKNLSCNGHRVVKKSDLRSCDIRFLSKLCKHGRTRIACQSPVSAPAWFWLVRAFRKAQAKSRSQRAECTQWVW